MDWIIYDPSPRFGKKRKAAAEAVAEAAPEMEMAEVGG